LSEKACKKDGIPYNVNIVHSLHHAGYYPGATLLHIKLISHKETRKILGTQIIGLNGVDKRVDVIAAAIHGNQTVEDLEDFDLAYAPPFGSAKDPILMSAFVASNVNRKQQTLVTVEQLEEMRKNGDDFELIDVRTATEFKEGTIPGAKLIPVDELRTMLEKLDKKKMTVVFCRVGMRGYLASRILTQNGFVNVRNLTGGYLSYKNIL
jgi:rhodanese-related sulfurtransferase